MANPELLPSRRKLLPPFVGDRRDEAWPGVAPMLVRRWRQARAARRGLSVLGWTLLSCAIQAALLGLPGRGRVVFARWYWAAFCRCIGLRVRVVGAPLAGAPGGRRVVFVANHGSWLDIPVLGGRLEACFVSKDAVAGWPGVSLVARLGRTVFVSRTRGATGRERDDMRARLAEGDNLLLFAEGTSSDGNRVLPFRSAFFSVGGGDAPPLIQPVSVAYDRLGGLPVGRGTRAVFAWYGDMDLARHFWQLAQRQGMRATVVVHPPLDPRDYADRKALAQAAWDAVAGGAAALRQNQASVEAMSCRAARVPPR